MVTLLAALALAARRIRAPSPEGGDRRRFAGADAPGAGAARMARGR
jgi:hypothetical protein